MDKTNQSKHIDWSLNVDFSHGNLPSVKGHLKKVDADCGIPKANGWCSQFASNSWLDELKVLLYVTAVSMFVSRIYI